MIGNFKIIYTIDMFIQKFRIFLMKFHIKSNEKGRANDENYRINPSKIITYSDFPKKGSYNKFKYF